MTDTKKILKLQRKIDAITYLLDDFSIHKEPWAISVYRKGERIRTKLEPVTTQRFLEPLLEKKTVIKMSATLLPELNYSYYEADSPFPAAIRPWVYHGIGRMSMKYREKTIPKVANFLSGLKGKTLVHCNSYKIAENLAYALRSLQAWPLVQTQDDDVLFDQETVSRNQAVDAFKTAKDEDKILLSVNLGRGVDFWEPNIVNNVIACLPFPNPTEALTIAKNKVLGTEWQAKYIAQTIVQAYGRVNRDEHKKTMTYIVDSNWSWWYPQHRSLFPKFFLEAKEGHKVQSIANFM